MEADNALLMAYVDGELEAPERLEIEKQIQQSPDVARRVAQLQASRQIGRDAFARQKLPPVPESLARSIAALAEAHRAGAADTGVSGAAAIPAPADRQAPRRSNAGRLRPALGWLVGAFAAGAVCAGVVLQVGPGLGLLPRAAPGPDAAVAMGAASWVRQAASYVALYSRATLADTQISPEATARTVESIERDDGLPLRIPDLSRAGLTFKGVQRLRFNGRPLVQIMYLPAQGDPVALCVIREPKPDQAVAEQHVDRMQVLTWRQSELGYALIGAPQGVDLREVASVIADRRVQALPLGSS
jgi:anti-sigma factor RsiW